jgi:hypothetical protein
VRYAAAISSAVGPELGRLASRVLASADALLDGLPDAQKSAGFLFLADLAVTLLAQSENRQGDEVAAEPSLHIAAHAPGNSGSRP